MAGRRSREAADDFEAPSRREPQDTPEPVPEWDLALIHVAQASVALKSNIKSTPVMNNIIDNLEKAAACLRKSL